MLDDLKSGLLKLNPTGEQGFEGLIAIALQEITEVPFRLASSGLQFGVDGKSAYDMDCICFEAKRYKDNISRPDVITKIADLARNNSYPDLVWVLGATSPVPTQLADDLRTEGCKDGITVLILDWLTELPPLAIALALGGSPVEAFLKTNIDDQAIYQKALSALEAIKDHKDFSAHASRIKAELDEPSVGTAKAKEANANWLIKGFSNTKSARDQFGQPLSPRASPETLIREGLSAKLKPLLTESPDSRIGFVLGDEGCGKSWIIAQSWLDLELKPLMIIFNPNEFQESPEQNDIDELLIAKLIKQTGDKLTAVNKNRWDRRLSAWKSNTNVHSPRFVVIIDGVNQKPNVDWGRVLDKMADELEKIGARLIVTARTFYFQRSIKGRLTTEIIEINVPEWMPTERDEVLTKHNIDPSALHAEVKKSLLNPRLLGIAIELLTKEELAALEDLSVSRLLFEHIRTNQRDALTPETVDQFVTKLKKHAQQIIDRKKQNQMDDLQIGYAPRL